MNDIAPQASASTDPIDAAIASVRAQNGGQLPETPASDQTPAEGQPGAAAPEREARRYAQERDAKLQAARAEKQAREQVRAAKERAESLAKEKAELESLMTGAKGNKAQIMKLLERSGLSIDDIARAALDLDEEPVTPEKLANEALAEAKALRKQLEEERAQKAAAEEQARSEAAANHYVSVIKGELEKEASDKYELVCSTGGYDKVLQKCIQFLQENDLASEPLSQEEEVLLIHHVAAQYEEELYEQAKLEASGYKRSKKLRELVGILSDNTTESADSRRDNDDASQSSSHEQVLEALEKDTTQAFSKGNKFITNDVTVSARPTAIASKSQSDTDREIDELVRAYQGKKPVF